MPDHQALLDPRVFQEEMGEMEEIVPPVTVRQCRPLQWKVLARDLHRQYLKAHQWEGKYITICRQRVEFFTSLNRPSFSWYSISPEEIFKARKKMIVVMCVWGRIILGCILLRQTRTQMWQN